MQAGGGVLLFFFIVVLNPFFSSVSCRINTADCSPPPAFLLCVGLYAVWLLLCMSHTAFNLEYYTQVQDLTYLIASMGRSPFSQRFRKLSQGLADVVEGYGLVGFTPLAIQVRGLAQGCWGCYVAFRNQGADSMRTCPNIRGGAECCRDCCSLYHSLLHPIAAPHIGLTR